MEGWKLKMLASILIKKLEERIASSGDLPVTVCLHGPTFTITYVGEKGTYNKGSIGTPTEFILYPDYVHPFSFSEKQ